MGSAVLGEAISAIRDWSISAEKGSGADRTRPRRSAAWCSTTACSRRVCRSRSYQALRRTITHGDPLDAASADAVAKAMKEWAVEHGATHYTHWFSRSPASPPKSTIRFCRRTATARRSLNSAARN
jgi:glutamine synthetase